MPPFLSPRLLVRAAVALVAAGLAWQYRIQIHAFLAPSPAARAPVVWDNGSVRDPGVAVPSRELPRGALRRCSRNQEAPLYTDLGCPPGWREAAVTQQISVVGAAPRPASQPRSLRESMGVDDGRLRDRAMERAIEAGSR